MKTRDFIRKHSACIDGAKWALSISEDMVDVWNAMIKQGKHDWLIWTLSRSGVFPDSVLRKTACKFVRETPLADGRKVWDLLTDARSRKAIEVAELYADGKATKEDMDAAYAAACAAACDAAADAAYATAYVASAASYAACAVSAVTYAASDAARAAASSAAGAAAYAACAVSAVTYAARAAVCAIDAVSSTAGAAAYAAYVAAKEAAKAAQAQMIAEMGNPFKERATK